MAWHWWAIFFLIVALLLAMDLGLFQRKVHVVGLPEAIQSTALRVVLALLFCLGIYGGWIGGYETPQVQATRGIEFLTGYLVEIALSMDNVFVFALVFKYFRTPAEHQQRILFWGILGALAMRGVLIFAGIALIETFHWIIYVFGVILIYGGFKMIRSEGEETDPAKNPVLKLFRRLVPVTPGLHGQRFFIRENGRLMATPLCVVLVAIETTDLIFAVDSIPAVLAVTRDPFVVFTSNVFAIIGLRAMYFALAGILRLFRFLHHGLSAILVFIGVKMLLSQTPYAIETVQSLFVVLSLLGVSIVASLVQKKDSAKPDA